MTAAKAKTRGRKLASPADTADIAVSLARIGWPVFPVTIYVSEDGKRSKVPAVPKGTSWKDWATTDEATIRAAFTGDQAGCWIGVYAGKAGIVVGDIDIEPVNGYAVLEGLGLSMPETFTYQTRGGGSHHIFAAPEGIDLTISGGLMIDGERHRGVDVRAGAGLMVYYGPKLKKLPALAPAPDWLLVTKEKTGAAADGIDRAPSADEEEFRSRLIDGKATDEVREAVSRVRSKGMSHDDMLEAVTLLVGLGVRGHRGVGRALDVARETYVAGWPDAGRHWDNAVQGSIRRLGLPPLTIALTKTERREVKARNKPEAIEKAAKKKAREYVARLVATRTEAAPDDISDDAVAERFAAIIRGTWANVPGLGLMRYNGVIWEPVDEMLLIERARLYLRDVRQEMTALAILRSDKPLEADAKRLGLKGTMTSVARLAAGILLEDAPKMDADPDLLNVKNGVVDLRTGELRDHQWDDYFTKCAAVEYHPGETSTDWDKALRAVPKKMRHWLQVRLGQAATGRISTDKSVPYLTGGGDNGKSAVLGAVRSALGSYAVTVPDKLLLGGDSEHPTEIMTLKGARFAVFEELPRGGRLNAQRMKLLAGTNELTGRYMGKDFVTFPATHTLCGSTNHLPVISDVDDAIWNRVAPVPLPYKFVNVDEDGPPKKGTNQRAGDPGLRDRLAEAPQAAVLTWLVAGAVESYRQMPKKPRVIQDAIDEWRGESDPVLGFVRDHLVRDSNAVIAATDLYSEFGRYLESRGQVRWSDALMSNAFVGHSSLEGVRKRQLRVGPGTYISRPNTLQPRPVAAKAITYVGIRFKDDPFRIKSEAEKDAELLADMERNFR